MEEDTRVTLVCGPTLRPAWDADRLEAMALRQFPGIVVARPDRGALAATLRDAGRRPGLVLLAGGDGLCQAAVNECRDTLASLEFGILPAGTGNDFARSLGMPRDPERGLSALAAGRGRSVDLLRVRFRDGDERLCVNAVLGGGLAAADPPEISKRWLGGHAYVLSGLRAVMSAGRVFRWTEDGTPRGSRVHVLALQNGRTVGGGVPLAPGARLDDGLLDLVAMRVTPMRLLPQAAGVLRGRHTRRRDVHTARCVRVEVTEPSEGGWNLDGEIEPRAVHAVEVARAALRVRGPARI